MFIHKQTENKKETSYRSVASSGFTLLELMIVLAIGGILTMAAAPQFSDVINRQNATSTQELLSQGIRAARLYGLTNRRVYALEAIGGDWSNGYIIRPGEVAGLDPISEVAFSFPDKIKVAGAGGLANVIVFDRLGRATPSNFTFNVCNEGLATHVASTMNVNIFGKVDLVKDVHGEVEYVAC